MRQRIESAPFFLALRVCLRAAPGFTLVMFGFALLLGLAPIGLYIGFALFAGEVARDPFAQGAEFWIVVVAGAFFIVHGFAHFLHQMNLAIGRRIDDWVQNAVMEAALRPSTVAHMETPTFRDAADLARNWEASAHAPRDAVYSMVEVVKAIITTSGSAILLLPFSWWAPLVLVSGYVLMTYWGTRVRETAAITMRRTESPLRRARYLGGQPFDPASGRESRLFGLSGWFRQGSHGEWLSAMAPVWRDRYGTRWIAVATVFVLIGSHLLVFALIMQEALGGTIDVTEAALYLQGAAGMVNIWFPWHIISLRESTRPFPALERLETAVEGARDETVRGEELPPGSPTSAITVRDVTFRYPGRPAAVFDGLDLTIHAGSALAIVGANGAGKTTLVKLLCGLLAPDEGTVEVDGRDLRAFREQWHERVAVIFQDFVRYPFTARDNVVVGRPLADPDALEAAVGRAIERSMASHAVGDLPDGLDTPLAREFGGVDLSGGQWQRLALARALYAVERGATVLVLDEPTAQLDVRAEAALFDRFLEITAGITTILISHRFSSVRHADRIVVLEAGRVVEDGTHADLLRAGGRYAEMFRQQARHFDERDGAGDHQRDDSDA
jgi:ABC-type multidrug transport system fused ATPase/permease subunit